MLINTQKDFQSQYSISLELKINYDHIIFLMKKLELEAAKFIEKKEIINFACYVRDIDFNIVGGLSGGIQMECLNIDQLWVDPNIRGQKFGSRLVYKAEKFAVENQCKIITVQTLHWEAPGFYEKLGYLLDFERIGYQNNSRLCFYSKRLAQNLLT